MASAAASPPAQLPTPSGVTVDGVAAEIVRRLNAKDAKGIIGLFGPAMREALPEQTVTPMIDGILAAKGHIDSTSRLPGTGGDLKGVFRLKAERGEWQVELHIDKEGKVLGLKFNEPPAPEPAVARSGVPLVPPFRGQWSVVWGGDKAEVNPHVAHKSQRRAADLVMVGADTKTHRGDGKKNDDYLAYGQEVVVVADGTVVTAIDGVPENSPGAMNPYFALGNSVIVKHSDTLYSAYAHLQPGKLRVKAGAKIKQGAVLGLCGNSGNSSEPHLHFQLQDGPLFDASWGIEAVLPNVTLTRDGKTSTVAEYTFLKGDLIGQPPKK